mmetsp:Transcript_22827/g.53998  ORF Transcript_22827/g.53998 Transcript_22827/m.53998 type:complete len:426 (-) Transcript_22827:236-1513(-)
MASALRRLLALGLALGGRALQGDRWHAALMEGWAREGECSATRLAGPDGAKCGAGTVLVRVPEDMSAEPIVDVQTVGGGGEALAAPFARDALVEIASISKIFTAVLLQQLVDTGRLRLQTQLGEILRCEGAYKHPEVLNISLLELASHTSGLPSWPDNRRSGLDNPFTDYSRQDLCSCLTRLRGLPTRGKFFYSNLAYGLLGFLMELHMGEYFEVLMAQRVLAPLGMEDTKVTLSTEEWSARVAPGHDPSTGRGPVWRRSPYGVLRGNGAFHSTILDMSRFVTAAVRAERGDANGPLSGTLRRTLQQITWDCPCVRGFCENVECNEPSPEGNMVALGWQSFSHGSLRGWKKAGDTEGYSSLMAFSGRAGRGAFGFDTCGGCGLNGTSGSAIQRVVMKLVLGPPSAAVAARGAAAANDLEAKALTI